ncbi:MAG: NUDIX hydrolase [Pedobacter sp.]|nr:MAG: NUDIX hydrolase [Pedobacter sp.]
MKDQQVLMVCHKGVINQKDVWLPPGGGMEDGETITETLVREFLEETGLQVKVGHFMFKQEFIQAPLHAIELYFNVEIQAGELIKGKDPETTDNAQLIKDVQWIPLQNYSSPI